MAIPKEFINERSEYIREQSAKYDIEDFDNLNDEDLRLIGFYIQLYSYIDLNVKSIYLTLKSNGIIKIKKGIREDFDYMIGALSAMAFYLCEHVVDDENSFKEKLSEIAYRRPHRNVLAHWAGKRIPDEDILIFMTSNNHEYSKMFDKNIEPGTVGTITYDAADLRGLAISIHSCERWIAHVFFELRKKSSSI